MDEVVVRRSPWRGWALAMLAVPFVILAFDFFGDRRIFSWFAEFVYGQGGQVADPVEARDVLWAAVFGTVGGGMLVIGLWELLVPLPVLKTTDTGLQLRLGHAFARPVTLSWENIAGLRPATYDEAGWATPGLEVVVRDRSELPRDPWRARWRSSDTLVIDASGWEGEVDAIVKAVTEYKLGRSVR